jgi:hypothetical protein
VPMSDLNVSHARQLAREGNGIRGCRRFLRINSKVFGSKLERLGKPTLPSPQKSYAFPTRDRYVEVFSEQGRLSRCRLFS